MNLTIEVSNNENEHIIKLNGEIDVYTATKLKNKLLPLVEMDGAEVQVDLLHTTYIDSTGLGVFISAYKATQKNDSKLELIHVQDRVLRLFQVTGLDRIMHVYESKVDMGDMDE